MEIIVAYPDAELIELYHSPCIKRMFCTLNISTISPSDLNVSSNFINKFIPHLRLGNYVARVTELNLSILIPPEMFWLTHLDEPVQVDKQRSYLSSIIGSITEFPNLEVLNLSVYYPDETVPTRPDNTTERHINSSFSSSSHDDTDACSNEENPLQKSYRFNCKPHHPFLIGNLCHQSLQRIRLGFPSSISVAFVFNVVHVPRCFKFATNLLPPCSLQKCTSHMVPCCTLYPPNSSNDRYIVGGFEYSVSYANGGHIRHMMKDFQYPHTRGIFKVHHGYFKQFTGNNIAIHDMVVRCGSLPFIIQDLSQGMIRAWELDSNEE